MNLNEEPFPTFTAALFGSLVGLKAIPGASGKEKVTNLLFGFLLAIYLGPAIVEYQHITSQKVAAAMIFSMGVGGLVLLSVIFDGVRQTQLGPIISSWLSRRGGA